MEPPPPEPNSLDLEQRYIESLLAAAPVRPDLDLIIPPGDDAAVLRDSTAITADTLVEGVHFDDRLSASDIGYKAVAVSASDLGAMGAEPVWMVLCLSLPIDTPPAWVDRFGTGLAAAAAAFSVSLIGGDTTRSPGPKVASITMGGTCVAEPISRGGGAPGDLLWVTGELGLAGAGWMLDDPPDEALARLRRPEPPLAFALSLARAGIVSAMMDLSDGLAADLPRLCRASDCGADVSSHRLPTPSVLSGHPDRLTLMIGGGEDYELIFASRPRHTAAIRELADEAGIRVTPIGELTAEPTLRIDEGPWPSAAFHHFGGRR